MVLMVLDHVRDFFSVPGINPLDLHRTTPALFLVRWATHFCAPVFVFLAGTGAFLSLARGQTRRQLGWFLLTRGLWLVVLEFTLVHLGWCFRFDYRLLLGQVIWAIGCSMVALAGLVFLPPWVILCLGVILVSVNDLGASVSPEELGVLRYPWKILCGGGFLGQKPGVEFYAAYPLFPWLGVMLAGYGSGKVWLLGRQRRPWLWACGIGLALLFVGLRAINRAGDPHPWSAQATSLFTVFSFINCTKYPPSLLFVLMTLGPALVYLAWWDGPSGWPGRFLVTFGRVPLFFYLLHLPVIHLLALGFALVRFGRADFLLQNIFLARAGSPWGALPPGYGYGPSVLLLVWVVVVALLYPACRWFAELKRTHRAGWLRYF